MYGILEVDTKGICFLCYNPSVVPISHLVRPARGFENLLHYLKVNPMQAFKLSPDLLESMEMDEDVHIQNVHLCQNCASICANFYRIYARYEMLQLQLDSLTKSVHETMVEGEKCPERVQEYRNRMKPIKTVDLMNASFAANLREETLKRCEEKLKIPPPAPPKTTYTAIFPTQISGTNQALLIPNEEGQEKDSSVENVIYAHTTVDDNGTVETEYQPGPYTEAEVYIEEENPPAKPPPKFTTPELVPEDSDYDTTSSSCFYCPFKATNRRSIPTHIQTVHPEQTMIKYMESDLTVEECKKAIDGVISGMVYSVSDHPRCIQIVPTFKCGFCRHIVKPRYRFQTHLINKHIKEFAKAIKEYLKYPPLPMPMPGGVKEVQPVDKEIAHNNGNDVTEVEDMQQDELLTETTCTVQLPPPAPDPEEKSESEDESSSESESSDPDYVESLPSPSSPETPPEPVKRIPIPTPPKQAKPSEPQKKPIPRMHLCEFCAMKCNHSGNLRYHTLEAHLPDLVEKELPPDTSRYNTATTVTNVLREVRNFKGNCCYCNIRKGTWNALKRHVLASHFYAFVDAVKVRLAELEPPVENEEQGRAETVEVETQAEVANPGVPDEEAMDVDPDQDQDQEPHLVPVNEGTHMVSSEQVEQIEHIPNQNQGVSLIPVSHAQGVSIVSADLTQGVSIVSADHTQGVSIVSADHTQGVSIVSADHTQGVSIVSADHTQGVSIVSADHTQGISIVSGDPTQRVNMLSADHAQGVIMSGDQTHGVSFVTTDHTQGVSFVSADHTQGVSIVSADLTQGVSIVSADHTQGIRIVPDHSHGLSMIPVDHSQRVSLHSVEQEPGILVPVEHMQSSNFISYNQRLGFVPNPTDEATHEIVIVQWTEGAVESENEVPQEDENSNSSLLRDLEA